jgi:pyrroline-5-carboxylate reductase
MPTRLIFLGGGNMAEAIFAGLINQPTLSIEVIQRNPLKAQRLKDLYPTLRVSAQLEHKLNPEDILFLAIKPQQAKEAIMPIKDKLSDCTLVSVMAGINCQTIVELTANSRIIRSMPNTPLSVGKGITALYASTEVDLTVKHHIDSYFRTLGMVFWAEQEKQIDQVVPISSSAIAFIYYFMEGLIDAAVNQFGFSHELASNLVKEAVGGSFALLAATPAVTISEQRTRVTSKKGATEQGLQTFMAHDLHHIIAAAVRNCYNKTVELGQAYN